MGPTPKATAKATAKATILSAPLWMLKSNSEGKSDPQGTGWEKAMKAFDPQNVQSKIPYSVLI